jgi:hypothetical protein
VLEYQGEVWESEQWTVLQQRSRSECEVGKVSRDD